VVLVPAAILPAAQRVHADAPAAEYLPRAQTVQLAEAGEPVAITYLPASHEVHDAWPAIAKVPAAQFVQKAKPTTPA